VGVFDSGVYVDVIWENDEN